MTNSIYRIFVLTAILGMAQTLQAQDDPDQADFPQVTHQPVDLAVPVGANAVFEAQATNANVTFQWYRNGSAIDGETNSNLVVANAGINAVGLYTCAIMKQGGGSVPTRSASLNVFADGGGGQITVYGLPVLSGGSQGGCPGAYAGYVNFTKTVSQGWGWAPSTNTTVHTASDLNRPDTKVQYGGKNGDVGCNLTNVTVPNPPSSPKYRFTIYFPNNVPTNSYAITLSGFDP